MGVIADHIYVNLPVKDLQKAIDFFTQIGFEFNEQFTDENATCRVINDNIFAMLLKEAFFQTFTKKEIADASKSTEVFVALSADSREKVDELVNKAFAAGGTPANDPMDHGFMYSGSFHDLDGHLWEVLYMDPTAVNQG